MAEYIKNSSKVINAEGKPLVPGAYELSSVILKRAGMPNADITRLITDMVFTEEIFSPVLVAKITISDNAGFFKQNPDILQGHEIIEINIRFVDYSPNKNNSLKIELSVREYGDFELDNEGVYSGIFTITAVDHFAILSRLQQISFAVGKPEDDRRRDKDPIEHIAYIFEKYLKQDPSNFNYNTRIKCSDQTKFRAIIPYSTPLQAIEWLRKKSFDADKSPFFVFGAFDNQSKLSRKTYARSWNALSDKSINPIYRNFIKKYNDNHTTDEQRYFAEKQRILEFTADVSKNELKKFLQGEYNSYIKTINYWASTYTDADTPNTEVPSVEQTLDGTLSSEQYQDRFSKKKDMQKKYLDTIYNDSQNIQYDIVPPATIIHNPFPLYGDSQNEYTSIPVLTDAQRVKNWHTRIMRYYNTKISNEQCEIVVYGDITLNPGKLLKLDIDSDVTSANRNGTYIVIASVHSFMNGIYINRLKLVYLSEN